MIKEIRPSYLLALSWLLWLFVHLISPARYLNITPYLPAIILLIAYVLFLYLGFVTIRVGVPSEKKKQYEKNKILKLILIVFLLGAIGVGLRFYQRLSFGFSFDLVMNRSASLAAGEGTGGVLSIVAALLFPFSFLAFMLCIYFKHWVKSKFVIIIGLFAAFPLLDSLLSGGRSVLFFQGIALFILFQVRKNIFPEMYISRPIKYWFIRVYDKVRLFAIRRNFLQIKGIIVIGLIALAASSVFIYINNIRAADYAKRLEWSFIFELSISDRLVDYPYATKENLYNSDNPLTEYGKLMLFHYVEHGPYEFIRWYNNTNNHFGTYYGRYQFYVFVKFFKMLGVLGGTDFLEMTEATKRVGVFTTFWGPVYLDFGYFGIFYAYFLGLVFKYIYFLAIYKKALMGLLSYPFVGAIIFSNSIIHAALGQNLYYLPAIFITVFLYQIKF